MASGNQELKKISANKSRLPNPLNVIVEKVGATRAMVHGDVSVESLRELLMSSLSLLPTTATGLLPNNDQESKKFDVSADIKTELRHKDEDEQASGSTVSKYTDKDQEPKFPSAAAINFDNKKNLQLGQTAGMEISKTDDDWVKLTSGKDSTAAFSNAKTNRHKTKSKKNVVERKKISGIQIRRKPKSDEIDDEAEEEEEEEEKEESLSSCLSVFDTEEPPFSFDARWLRRNFEKPLVQGLRDVAKKKPQDPVNYLAFCLRNYRNEEEVKRRKRDFENDLQKQRLFLTSEIKEREESIENLEPQYYNEGEEGGGNEDSNFKDYYRA